MDVVNLSVNRLGCGRDSDTDIVEPDEAMVEHYADAIEALFFTLHVIAAV